MKPVIAILMTASPLKDWQSCSKVKTTEFNPLRGGQALQAKLALQTLSHAVLVVYAGKKRQQSRR